MAAGPRQRRREALTRQAAPGRVRVLAVGVDEYDSACGFDPLTTRRNDATGFADCFRDIAQLGAGPDAARLLVARPSRGEIIKGLRELVRASAESDRVIFYFSGRGHRLPGDPEVYLVPQDAYADDDPGCLIPLSLVEATLGGAPARQRLVILDLCGELAAALAERPCEVEGVALLASSLAGAGRSPNPQHSPFTALLLPALRGEEPAALAERRLTLASLHRFLADRGSRWGEGPSLRLPTGGGEGLLADFSGPLLSPSGLVDGRLFDSLELSSEGRPVPIKQILRELSRSHYSQSYLEERANAALGEHLEEALGRAVSRLRAQFKWASSAVTVDGAGIRFPDGHYAVRYEATEKLRGVLVEELSLRAAWLDAPNLVAGLLECLQLDPVRARFALREGCAVARCVPKLEASGWRIASELPHKVEAVLGECTLLLEEQALTLVDLPLRELFAATPDREVVRRAAGALAVFAAG
jgi:hypothetical protein